MAVWNQKVSFAGAVLAIYDVLESPLIAQEFELRIFCTSFESLVTWSARSYGIDYAYSKYANRLP